MRLAVLVLMIASMSSLSACTVIGALVGANTPKSSVVPPSTMGDARGGEIIEVTFVDSLGPHVVTGRFGGNDRNTLLIDSSAGTSRIPIDWIQQIRVEKGDYGVEGMIAGLLADTAIATAVILVVDSSKFGSLGGGHW